MLTTILSLILILFENSLPISGIILIVALSFSVFVIGNRKNYFILFLIYILISLQTNEFFFIFIIYSLYVIILFLIFNQIEYLRTPIFSIIPIQIIFYLILTYNFFSIKYFIINTLGLIVFNKIYIKISKIMGLKRKNDAI